MLHLIHANHFLSFYNFYHNTRCLCGKGFSMNAHENLFLSGICSVTIEVVAVIVAGGFVSLVSPTYKQYFSAIFSG